MLIPVSNPRESRHRAHCHQRLDQPLPARRHDRHVGLAESGQRVDHERDQIIRADPNGYTLEQVFDGLDVTVNSRVSSDLFFYGGVGLGGAGSTTAARARTTRRRFRPSP